MLTSWNLCIEKKYRVKTPPCTICNSLPGEIAVHFEIFALHISSYLPVADSEAQRFLVIETEHCRYHAGV